jgi:hypothetical protein
MGMLESYGHRSQTEDRAKSGRGRLACSAAALALGLLALPGIAAAQQVLAVQGDHFTVNGQPKFLTFISYFDGRSGRRSRSSI